MGTSTTCYFPKPGGKLKEQAAMNLSLWSGRALFIFPQQNLEELTLKQSAEDDGHYGRNFIHKGGISYDRDKVKGKVDIKYRDNDHHFWVNIEATDGVPNEVISSLDSLYNK